MPPHLIHHRANMDERLYPECSLAAIRACLEAEVYIMEIDVQALAADDYLVYHDLNLDSKTTGTGTAADHTVESAKSIKYKDSDHGVALLSEVVALFADYPNSTRIQMDYKNMIPFPDDEPIERFVRLIEPLGQRVTISTGAEWQLRKMRRLAPWLDLGFDPGLHLDWAPEDAPRHPQQPPFKRGAYGYLDDHMVAQQKIWPIPDYLADRYDSLIREVDSLSTFYLSYRLIAQFLKDGFNPVEHFHAAGIAVSAYTMNANNPDAVDKLPLMQQIGVDRIATDTPKAIGQLLAE